MGQGRLNTLVLQPLEHGIAQSISRTGAAIMGGVSQRLSGAGVQEAIVPYAAEGGG